MPCKLVYGRCGSIDQNNPKPKLGLPDRVNTCSLSEVYSLIVTDCVKNGDGCNEIPIVEIYGNLQLYFKINYLTQIDGFVLTTYNWESIRTGLLNIRGRIENCGASSDFSFELILHPAGQNGC